uniref:Uncharacterized protein n=1 Tax=Bubo bubo TaxID=30461 RepID=A0A8C0EZZ3_BUBBB
MLPKTTHVAEDHGLGNGDSAVDITESLELLISVIAQNVILLNSVQRLLLSLQFDNVWVRNNFLSKLPHRILKKSSPAVPALQNSNNQKKQKSPQAMYAESLPLNADALVLMALGCYHHVSLIQDEHFDFLGIYELQFGTPVQHSAGCADYNLLFHHLTALLFVLHITFSFTACWYIRKFQLRIKLSHLFNHFSSLKCQLVRWGKAQTLEGEKGNNGISPLI